MRFFHFPNVFFERIVQNGQEVLCGNGAHGDVAHGSGNRPPDESADQLLAPTDVSDAAQSGNRRSG